MMRRESRPFVVEVRRGQKRTPVVPPVEQPEQPPPLPDNGLDEIFRRAEAALFDRATPHRPEPSVAQDDSAASKRRILENLNEVDPLVALLAERGEPSRRGRKPGSKNKPKDVSPTKLDPSALANLKGRVELTPERINEALKSMERVSPTASPRSVKSTPSHAARSVVEEVEDSRFQGNRFEATENSLEAAASTNPVSTVAEARPRERGSIRGRYVVGSELKPGERWKRRLRVAR